MTHSRGASSLLSRILLVCITALTVLPTALCASRMIPVVFAAGLLLPNTDKKITPNNPEVEQRLREYFEQNIEVIFLHSMGKRKDPWLGVLGTISEYSVDESTEQGADSSSQTTSFGVNFTDLAQVHAPFTNIKKVQGKHYARNVTLIKDVDSPQTVATFLHEIILPSLPSNQRSQKLRSRLTPLTSINQIVQELIIYFKLDVSEDQAVQFLEFNFSIQDKLRLLMELFEQARKSGKLKASMSGSSGSRQDEFSQFQEKLETLDLPEQAREELIEALEQYEGAKDNPHEGPMLRNYLKFALALPWKTGKVSGPELDLAKVEKYLNKHQYGMEEVKDRVLDYLALRDLAPEPTPTIICLVGAPGVGKTSISKIIADALDKKFARIALGGVHAEAEVRGHRRTYVGAMPGRILEAMKRAGSPNPVLVLDEIDKLGTQNAMHGDPSAALLEALDPEQNNDFVDHYLGVGFDLSRVIFIATANDEHKIPDALRDRMDIIQVPSYTVDEKINIARRIIVPKLIKRSGLTKNPPKFSDDVIKALIENYTFEDGMRGLTNKLNVLIAKYARGYLKNETVTFTPDNLSSYLGKAHGQLDERKRKAKEIEHALTPTARKKLFDAIKRLTEMHSNDPERTRLQEYIDFFLSLPWDKETNDNDDLSDVEKKLEAKHYGLGKVNERILDSLAMRKRSEKARANILCLVGNPGVGKTSVAEAIAKALNRKYERVALGGVHMEHDIRGHSRSFVGASPGKILQAVAKADSKNALILLDEIDKMGESQSNGDPKAALLEVLDPEQNKAFSDHYLGVPFDLSKVMFIATANSMKNIPFALYDRMEFIHLDGYNVAEKIYIARQHILPKLLEQAGLTKTPPKISDELLEEVIVKHTEETGVRKLKNKLNTIIAKYARGLEQGKKVSLTIDSLKDFLGQGKTEAAIARLAPRIGTANGLYGGPLGGGMIIVEAVLVPGKGGKVKLTGNLGKNAQETAYTALAYACAHGKGWGVDPYLIKEHNLHIHYSQVGEAGGGDGPSAGGITTAAIVSLLSHRPIRHDYAMTGTINLRGNIGPIGGLPEKIDGARRLGMKTIIAPLENKHDYNEMKRKPSDIKAVFVNHIDQALDLLLLPKQQPLQMLAT